MTNINWTKQWPQLIVEQEWKHPHLVDSGASSCSHHSVDAGEKQQLCCRVVHLLQKSLCRELLTELGYTDLGDAVHAGWGDPYLAHATVPSDPQRDNFVFEPWARPLCVQFPGHWWNSDQHMMTPRKNVQQCGTTCHCTPAEDSYTMGLHTLSSRAHSFCVSLILPLVLPLMQVGFLLGFFSFFHGHGKRSTGFEMWAKNSSWILRFRWMTLWISVFKSGSAKFDSSCWWHSQPQFLRWLPIEVVSSCVYGGLLCLWTGRNQESQSAGPGERCDIEFCSSLTLSLICTICLVWLSSHLSELHQQVFVQEQYLSHGHSCEKPLFR